MWQRFTEPARKLVFYAQEEAGRLGHNAVAPEHMLLGVTRVPDSVGALMLEQLGVSMDALRMAVEANISRGTGRPGQDMQLAPRAKRVIDLAYDEARRLKNNYIGVEHLVLGMLRDGESDAAGRTLMELGVTLDAARTQLLQMQDGGDTPPLTGKLQDMAAYMKAAFSPEADKPTEELLSLDEAVKFLGTSKPTLYRLLGQDEIRGLKVGRQWRFRRADLTAYMERGPVAVSAAPKEDLDMELAFFSDLLGQTEPSDADAEAKTVRLAENIFELAIQSRASDIHLEPNSDDFLLRLRVDGVLQEIRRLPSSTRESLTARFKIMAEMDTNEKRLPQDGRIPVRHEDKDFDFRVAVVPSMHGEAVTMRILDRSTVLIGLDRLGIATEDLHQIRDLIRQPNGIVIATGPTGAGKTTLLYSCLQESGRGREEDPDRRGPRGVCPALHHADPGEQEGRPVFRHRPALVPAARPGCHPGQRDARPRNRPHRGRGLLDRASAPDVPAHRRCPLGPAAPAGHGRRAVPRRGHRRGRRRHPPGAPGLRRLQAARGPVRASRLLGYVAQLAAQGGYEIPADAVFVRGVPAASRAGGAASGAGRGCTKSCP